MECQIQNITYVKWAIHNVKHNNIVILRDVMSSYFRKVRSAKLRNNLRLDQEAHFVCIRNTYLQMRVFLS